MTDIYILALLLGALALYVAGAVMIARYGYYKQGIVRAVSLLIIGLVFTPLAAAILQKASGDE